MMPKGSAKSTPINTAISAIMELVNAAFRYLETVPDSAAAVDLETAPDSVAAVEAGLEAGLESPPDSFMEAGFESPPDSGSVAVEQDSRIPEPRLEVSDRANWVAGDTLYAIFLRPEDPAVQDSTAPAVPLSVTDSIAQSVTPAPPADSTSDAKLERIRVAGNARSFYATVRDTTTSSRASRNYLLGSVIEVVFKDGDPERVFGEKAIGVYLDPMEASAGALNPAEPARFVPDEPMAGEQPVVSDSTRADSVIVEPPPADTVRADSASAVSTGGKAGSLSIHSVGVPVGIRNPEMMAQATVPGRGSLRGRCRESSRVQGR